MRDHLWDKPAGAVSLWYDAQTMDTFRSYARLHVSLFPEYMLGEKLLIAPVLTEGSSTRSLYLPEGSWIDYWSAFA